MRIESQIDRPNRSRAGSLLLGFVLLAGCAAVNPRSEVRGMPPCPITLAVDDFGGLPSLPSDESAMYMTANSGQLQDLLWQSLNDLRAASRVVRLSDLGDPSEADVVLTPRLKNPVQFTWEGWAGSWWASGGLWLVTWIGGLVVNDSTYSADMTVDCEFRFERSGNPVQKNLSSTAIDVTFLERNDFLSWPTVQSFVLPPFLTSDQPDPTRDALTRRALDSVALQLARYLKRDFETDSRDLDYCMVRIDSPTNGATVTGDTITLRGTIVPVDEVIGVSISVNGGDAVDAKFERQSPPDVNYPNRGTFRCQVGGLRKGDNYIRILVTAGDEYSRTLVVTRH